MKKIVCITKFASLFLMIVFLMGSLLACKKDSNEMSYVTIETNPSIELVVDGSGEVVAANGTNDDGKMLVEGEEIVGKDVESACELIVELTEKTGFTISTSTTSNSVEIKVSVSGSSEEFQNDIETKVKDSINKTITDLGLDAKVVEVEAKARKYFEKLVMAYDPTLTEEEVKEMSYQELMVRVKEATIEKATFITVALQDYYEELKAYEFQFKYKEELAKSLGDSYQTLKTQYDALLQEFSKAIAELKAKEVEFFVSEDSTYVKAVNAYNKAKQDLMEIKIEIAVATENGESTLSLNAQLQIFELAFTAADAALELATQTINTAFELVNTTLDTIYSRFAALEEQFPETIDFEEKLTIAENYINTSKDELFAKFEETFSEEKLAEYQAAVEERKAALIESVNNSKK